MSRLWSHAGAFRTLSVSMLALGVLGGVLLGADRQSQHRAISSGVELSAEQDELDDLQQLAEDRRRATAADRSARREASAKALAAATSAQQRAKEAEAASRSTPRATPAPRAPFGPIPASCSVYTGNVAIGCTLTLQAGFGLDQVPCLKELWMKESGWNERAQNRSSGAYGIPQALPASKMAAFGDDYRTNPVTQIKWGLSYIKGRYSTPCGAWSFFQSRGYY